MEAQTGVTLVQRTARGSSLTAEGAVIAQWAARVVDVAGELDAEIAAGRLTRIEIPELDLSRALRAIWNGSASPPAGPARDLVTHILSLGRQRLRSTGS
jgi:hypothetical protein